MKKISYEEVLKLKENYFLIDVRTPQEYSEFHIKDSINIDYSEIEYKIGNISKNAKVILYCRSGNRSAIAQQKLINLGFKDVSDLGSFLNWKGNFEK